MNDIILAVSGRLTSCSCFMCDNEDEATAAAANAAVSES